MTTSQKRFMHLSTFLATITGVAYGWMKYLLESDDPFSVVNHPWQPTMLHLHVILVPPLVFGLGWITSNHIAPKFRSKAPTARRSGLILMTTAVLMIASGYLIQVTTGETLLRIHELTHWITSGLFVVGYLVHQFIKPTSQQRTKPQPARAGGRE